MVYFTHQFGLYVCNLAAISSTVGLYNGLTFSISRIKFCTTGETALKNIIYVFSFFSIRLSNTVSSKGHLPYVISYKMTPNE